LKPRFVPAHAQVADLLEHGMEEGCLELSEVERLTGELDLDNDDVEALYEEIDARQIARRDDCGRARPPGPRYENGELRVQRPRGAQEGDPGTRSFRVSSESVTEGHPDKVADRISDAVLDEVLTRDPSARVACEVLVTSGFVVVAGELATTAADVDVQQLVRTRLRELGYDRIEW